MTDWREVYEGGGADAERLVFEKLARDMMAVQLKIQRHAKTANPQRAFHAKTVFAARDADLRFLDDLPKDLCAGFAQPGKAYSTIVRLSNADGERQADSKPDLRGIALRVAVGDGETHDLPATNFPVSHARNARQFVAFAKATAGGSSSRLIGLVGLSLAFGPSETVRMVDNVLRARRRKVTSLALETYWSRGAIRWGETLAVRYLIRPASGVAPASGPSVVAPNLKVWIGQHTSEQALLRQRSPRLPVISSRKSPTLVPRVCYRSLIARRLPHELRSGGSLPFETRAPRGAAARPRCTGTPPGGP